MNRAASQTYGMQQVMTSSPTKLVAMLHDKAIVSLKEAIKAIEAGEIEQRWRANKKAVDIITHLHATLDHQAGGEITENLERIYDFMLARLLVVDMKNDAESAREVIGLLEPLRASWHQLAENADGTAPAAAAGPSSPATPGQSPSQKPANRTQDAETPAAPPQGLGSFDLSA